MVDDGAPPPETVVIERVCNGNARAEGYTDRKGYFSIDLGMDRGVLQDASTQRRTLQRYRNARSRAVPDVIRPRRSGACPNSGT